MRARFINEKFTQDSDPIKDMGIGLIHKRKFNSDSEVLNWLVDILPLKLNKSESETKQWVKKLDVNFSLDILPPKLASFIYVDITLKIVDITVNNIKTTLRDVFYNNMGFGTLRNILLKRGYKFKGWLPGHMYEKFTQDSDPIKDMGIGLINKRRFKDMNDYLEWIVNIFPNILDKTPEEAQEWYYSRVKNRDEFLGYEIIHHIGDFLTDIGNIHIENLNGEVRYISARSAFSYISFRYITNIFEKNGYFNKHDVK